MPAVKLSPIFNSQIVDANGAPAVGWKIYTYAAGSSNPLATYTNSTGATPQSNPIVLNALGFPTLEQIWLQAGLSYKLVLTDANNQVQKTEDNISGVNDATTSTDEWADTGLTPTYISPTSFSFQGDQTSAAHVGRRVKALVTAGTVYGTIKTSVFASSITTITLDMDGAQVLDSGLSVAQLSILRANVLSLPVRRATTTGVVNVYAAAVGIQRVVFGEEYKINFALANDGAAAPTLNLDSTGPIALILQDGSIPTPGSINGEHRIQASSSGYIVLNPNVLAQPPGSKRQAINYAPVDANGFVALGGATGGTSVTTTAITPSTPFVVNAAGGISARGKAQDRIGFAIANMTFSGLNINGQMYLSVDVAANGALTPVVSTLQTIYQRGGAFSVVNGQHSVNTELYGQALGNGTAATQVYRVPVGEVTVAGGVVTTIIWYRMNRRFVSAAFAWASGAGAALNINTNLGIPVEMVRNCTLMARLKNAVNGYSVGQLVQLFSSNSQSSSPIFLSGRNTLTVNSGASTPYFIYSTTPGGGTTSSFSNADYDLFVLSEGDF